MNHTMVAPILERYEFITEFSGRLLHGRPCIKGLTASGSRLPPSHPSSQVEASDRVRCLSVNSAGFSGG
ncbi:MULTISPECIES: hypothetical protein [Brucella]|uniref:Uncharacterized protein n=3 Tax=Brucella TaxID=234 RepID=A0A0E1WXK9_9HYPH|nr:MULTISPECIES: hypothetical protein [Brucella]AEK55549.1 hypothetical protein BPI_II89 [Brucella pinnipedialis B2/94]EEX85197.1 predicted protein [Brucella ceti B1/94]EEX88387.1 predicted protein [Brucella ceti M13/05/1]EEX95783.1 predicted protein [Brucella ceti M644/93/1]EEY01681.1 predicted protein [Brucella pinnipedialis B2/94]